MITIQGKGVSAGVIKGKLYFYKREDTAVTNRKVEDLEAEKARFAEAQQQSIAQLEELADKCREEAGEESAVLFETHAMFVEDEDYVACVMDTMESESCCAEYAVQTAGNQFAEMFAAMEDAYMQARSADILDVSRRIINNLMGVSEGGINSNEPIVLAADDLAPSETLQMDKSKILGFVTQGGSSNSHTAILARTMGIPAICGFGEALKSEYEGRMAYIDGETGLLILDPDEITLTNLKAKYDAQQKRKALLQTMKGQEDVTLDGKHIKLYCNIGSPEDVNSVLANDGQGIGLFRSEFLYLAADYYPTEEEQFQAYKKVAEAMDGKRVIIRTLDIGADKQVAYFNMPKEENPAMGIRAIRISLNRPEVFRTQLRALYRASAYGNLMVMFPMVASVWELKEAKALCAQLRQELTAEGIETKDVPVGVMVETPAAAVLAHELAKEAAFFSVGTNDLTQYTLAVDRQNANLGRFYDPYHPALMALLAHIAKSANEAGIWAGICGELGADPKMTETFIKMGYKELSMAAGRILEIRKIVCESEQ